jgi:hypothetical protein
VQEAPGVGRTHFIFFLRHSLHALREAEVEAGVLAAETAVEAGVLIVEAATEVPGAAVEEVAGTMVAGWLVVVGPAV